MIAPRVQDPETAEALVIAALVDRPTVAEKALALLTPDSFTSPWYRAAFSAAQDAQAAGRALNAGVIAQGVAERGMPDLRANMQRLENIGLNAIYALHTQDDAIGYLRSRDNVRVLRERIAALEDPEQLEDVLLDGLARMSPAGLSKMSR